MNRAGLERRLQALWYGRSAFYRLLLPLSWLYCALTSLRRAAYHFGLLQAAKPDCKVVVVGGIVVGGSGKTPLVVALARILARRGLRIGILCRGYRGRATRWPVMVDAFSQADEVGDEALLVAQKTGLPVAAGPRRAAAARVLLAQTACDVLVCDDGLQHYALQRDVEIAVVDADCGYGNGACLPAGPLRERPERLRRVDAVVALGGPFAGATTVMHYTGGEACRLQDPAQCRALETFAGGEVHAVAGIAHPQRFFRQLREAGVGVIEHAFDDHHRYAPADLVFADGLPVLMTGKDAVKCRPFSQPHWWVVPIDAQLEPAFVDWLIDILSPGEH